MTSGLSAPRTRVVLLWSRFAPDFMTTGWKLIATALVGATAAGSIGVAVDSGLERPAQDDRVGQGAVSTSIHEERAVVAVAESQVRHATGLLLRIGVDRILV